MSCSAHMPHDFVYHTYIKNLLPQVFYPNTLFIHVCGTNSKIHDREDSIKGNSRHHQCFKIQTGSLVCRDKKIITLRLTKCKYNLKRINDWFPVYAGTHLFQFAVHLDLSFQTSDKLWLHWSRNLSSQRANDGRGCKWTSSWKLFRLFRWREIQWLTIMHGGLSDDSCKQKLRKNNIFRTREAIDRQSMTLLVKGKFP